MEEDDEDRLFLSSLGITSANPEDIERKILSEVAFLSLFTDEFFFVLSFSILANGLVFL